MPTPIEQLLSRTVYATDGTTVNWDFSFASGYLGAAHVKAQTKDADGAVTQVTVTPGMLIGEFQLQITPALASGLTLTIYRDTPKNAPLVDFNDESGFSEIALDTNAKQAVMVAAEAIDTINSSDLTAAVDAAEAAGAAAAAASASAALAAASVASIGTAVTDAEDAADAAIAAAASINPASFATAAQGVKADTAVQPAGFTVAAIGGATALGRGFMAVVDAAAARVLLGLSTFGSLLVQAADAATARTILGAAASGVNTDITSLGSSSSTIYTTAGTATAYTITPNPVIASYAVGQSFVVNFNAASGASPTLQISGIATPPNLVKLNKDGSFSNIAANEIQINHRSRVTLISTTQALVEELNPVVSMVRVNTANGYGSANNAIKRYATVVATQGTDITYADSATLGASFTINAAGVYSISGNVIAAATSSLGASLNSSQLTSVIGSITAADRLIAGYGAGGNVGCFSVSVYLPSGSVIRPHSDGNASTSAAAENFTVTRVC